MYYRPSVQWKTPSLQDDIPSQVPPATGMSHAPPFLWCLPESSIHTNSPSALAFDFRFDIDYSTHLSTSSALDSAD